MQKILLEPHYLPGIRCFKEMLEAEEVLFFRGDAYLKQSYRNRCRILAANGILDLSIPVQHPANRKPFPEVLTDRNSDWARQHWNAIRSAYQKSPYFAHFSPELEVLITDPLPSLWEHNIRLIGWLFRQAGQAFVYRETTIVPDEENILDRRSYWHPKKEHPWEWASYPQVFDRKFGFQADLSILDFMCNVGV